MDRKGGWPKGWKGRGRKGRERREMKTESRGNK